MRNVNFKKTVGIIVKPCEDTSNAMHLNFGQTVDVLNENSSDFLIIPHGEKTTIIVSKEHVQLYDTIYDSPYIVNPRFKYEN